MIPGSDSSLVQAMVPEAHARGTASPQTVPGRAINAQVPETGSFALVIPALNEEEAIGSTLERALAARNAVIAQTPVEEMFVVFVNDGSSDRTQEIADGYPEVIKLRFEKNRGYGAAIKEGFQATDAQLVGFMDADGTCDPGFCVQLIQRLIATNADVVIGARLNPDSKMPVVRRMGNWMFARLIGVISGQKLTDCASGMRVIRRSSLRRMVPLPDGLHFTPVMSCIATLDPQLRIEEVPMPYEERVGRSKLNVIKDGVRFLSTILFAALCYNPLKTLASLGLLCCGIGMIVGYVGWVRGVASAGAGALAAAGGLLFGQAVLMGVIGHQLLHILIGRSRPPQRLEQVLEAVTRPKVMVIVGLIALAVGSASWVCGVAMASGTVHLCASATFVVVGAWLALGGVVLRMIWAVSYRAKAGWRDPYASKQGEQEREE